ncbi:Hypothetical protein, putative [Bodo saltans]|uniref:Uncharacterized protein n=1 Tax=Bodo saltans TaxID=75058 RepID=A0A0S4JD00_BODSA|nr:Hypothetical protein, putative [Bodo saltans]|eukprot:CUG89346.1 Hypothetical protein, putative [Bodo saltans]
MTPTKASASPIWSTSPSHSASHETTPSRTSTITPPPTPTPTVVGSLNLTNTLVSASSTAAVYPELNAMTFSKTITTVPSSSHTLSQSSERTHSIISPSKSVSAPHITGSISSTPTPTISVDPTKTLSLKSTRTLTPITTPTQSATASVSNEFATISYTSSQTMTVATATLSEKATVTFVSETATQTVSPSPTLTLTDGELSTTKTSTATESYPSASVPIMTTAASYFSVCRGYDCLPTTSLLPQRVSVVTNKSFVDGTPSKSALGSKPLYIVSAGDALTLDFVGSTNDGSNDKVVLVNIATTVTSPVYLDAAQLGAQSLSTALSQIETSLCSQLETYYNMSVSTNNGAQSFTQLIPFDAVELLASPFTLGRWTTALSANGTSITPAPLSRSSFHLMQSNC